MKVAILLLVLALFYSADSACTYKSVRLYNGTAASNSSGMLQMCRSNAWTAVCDYRWKQSLSVKVCKALGYTNPTPITSVNYRVYWNTFGFVASTSSFCRTTTPLTSTYCLLTSSIYLNNAFYCNKQRDTIHIDCAPSSTTGCTYRQIRLYNTTNPNSTIGMLQICNSAGEWTAVCDYSWSCLKTSVACRHLGYTNAVPRYSINGGPWTKFGFGPYSYCSPNALNLFNCSSFSSSYRTNTRYCDPIRDTVELQCLPTPRNITDCATNYEVRLVGGKVVSEGKVEVCYQNQWTPICSYSLNQKAASTICNQLGYRENPFAKVITDGRFEVQSDHGDYRYLYSTYCRNTYNNIKYCSLWFWSSCSISGCYYKNIGLRCYEPQNCTEGDIRLVNGTVEREGRLEVCASGVWGTVCSYNFAKSAAFIACKQLGHNNFNGAKIDTLNKYGAGDGPLVYGNVECFGHETSLSECTKYLYPNFSCYYGRVVGILCLDLCTEGNVRLVGGPNNMSLEGTVEICLDKSWSLIAQHGWDDNDARVICKQLGVNNPQAGAAVYNSTYGKPKRAIRYSNVYCRGNEKEIADCTHHTFEFEYGRTLKVEVAGVNCGMIVSETSSIPPTTTLVASSSSSNVIIVNSPTSRPERITANNPNSVFISGLLFLIIGVCVLVIAIIIMFAVVLRIKKIFISQSGRNSAVQQMSKLPPSDSSVELTKSMSEDDNIILH